MNRTRLRWPLAAVALALAAGCDDKSTGPEGETSTVVVRAYVDVDGSGTFNAGDVAIAGQQVTLEASDGGAAAQQATTSSEGVATFADVRAGSYIARFGGTAPEGAVLATATNAVVVAPFDGGTVDAEFRFVFNPGSIQGRLYRDNNGNGVYDAGTDTPAPGIPVTLYAGGTATGDAFATTTTAADGTFEFSTLRPGTWTYVFSPLPTMQITGGSTVTVEVGAQEDVDAVALFTGNLISSIADVRTEAPGTTVAFEGVVTAGVGIFSTSTTGNQFNVQDASGAGILVLQTPLSSGIQTGDSVRVVGTTAVSAGEFLITGNPTVTILASNRPVPAPRVITAQQVAESDASDPLQGALVQVGNVRVTAVSGTATSTAYNVTVQDDAGNQFVIRVGTANVGIPQTYWQVGRYYDIVGTLANFNGAQVKVRSAADVSLRSDATPIGMLRAMAFADSAGTRFDTVTVEGVVHTAQGTFRNDNAFIQDPTGGILLFNVPADAGLELGDSVRVTGRIDWFNGELEIVRMENVNGSTVVVEPLGAGATPQPRLISGAQMLSRAFEGQLVRLTNATLDSLQGGTAAGYNLFFTAADGNEVQLRVENAGINLPRTAWTVGNVYNIVGALSHFRGTPQLKPRSAADVTPGTSGVESIAVARTAALNDTVTIEGVVTVAQGTFRNDNVYIQDATGGIQVFNVPTDADLDIGDLVRVTGLMGQFNGERQVVRFSASSPPVITVIGGGAVPAPVLLTGAQVLANANEGQLATATDLEVVSVGNVSSSTGSYNVTMLAPDGTTFTVRIENRATGIESTFFIVGENYDVTGVVGSFNGAGQLKPRSMADVVRR